MFIFHHVSNLCFLNFQKKKNATCILVQSLQLFKITEVHGLCDEDTFNVTGV